MTILLKYSMQVFLICYNTLEAVIASVLPYTTLVY